MDVVSRIRSPGGPELSVRSGRQSRRSGIIFDFTIKSNFFLTLGACRLKKRILVLVLGLWAGLNFISCGGAAKTGPPSGLTERVLASQGVSTAVTFPGLMMINGENDTLPRVSPISAGSSPGLMVLSPGRNLVASFDASTDTVYGIDTSKESAIGSVRLPGPTISIAVPTADPAAYAAVPTATVNGFTFQGAVESMNFSTGSLLTIAIPSAQTVFSNSTGTQLLVFSADSDLVYVVLPGSASPPVDTSCLPGSLNPTVCTIVQDSRFSRPVFAIESGSTAYILNCGFQCGGTVNGQPAPPSVAIFDLASLTITQTIPVDAATMAFLSGSTLYVAGTPTIPGTLTNNLCPASQKTAATNCGMLDIVDLGSAQVTSSIAITDGFHDRMDMTSNGQLFIGSYGCSNIGNVNNPSGEVRGCLSIYHTADGSLVVPPDNGDVTGLQGFTSRYVEYVAEDGNLRVYDTTQDILLINDFVPQGSISIVGNVVDVKAIDFF